MDELRACRPALAARVLSSQGKQAGHEPLITASGTKRDVRRRTLTSPPPRNPGPQARHRGSRSDAPSSDPLTFREQNQGAPRRHVGEGEPAVGT